MKIQIGAGNRPLPGFQNYDIEDSHWQVSYAPANNIPCEDHSVELVFSNAFFEHIAPQDYASIFQEWHRILNSNGSMVHMGIPWFDYIARIYLTSGETSISREMLVNWTLGETDSNSSHGNFHKNLLNKEELKIIFENHGFKPVSVYNYCYPGEDLPVNLCVIFGNVNLTSIANIESYIDWDSILEINNER